MAETIDANEYGANGRPSILLSALWDALVTGLAPIWPATRTKLHGVNMGDVWPISLLGGDLVPFHKLTQWMCYSLVEVFERVGNWSIVGSGLTGLPEYRVFISSYSRDWKLTILSLPICNRKRRPPHRFRDPHAAGTTHASAPRFRSVDCRMACTYHPLARHDRDKDPGKTRGFGGGVTAGEDFGDGDLEGGEGDCEGEENRGRAAD